MERGGWKHHLEEESPSGYCLTGRIIMFVYGAASQDFLDHVNYCPSCDTALTREKRLMEKETDADRRSKRE